MLLFVNNQHFTPVTAFITFVKTVSFHENILGVTWTRLLQDVWCISNNIIRTYTTQPMLLIGYNKH